MIIYAKWILLVALIVGSFDVTKTQVNFTNTQCHMSRVIRITFHVLANNAGQVKIPTETNSI